LAWSRRRINGLGSILFSDLKAAPSTSVSPSPSPNSLSITHFPSLDPTTSLSIFANNSNNNNDDPHAEEHQPSKITTPPCAFSPSLSIPSGAVAVAAAVVAAGAAPITIPPPYHTVLNSALMILFRSQTRMRMRL